MDVSEFEKRRDQVHKDENGAQWNLAKSFEHTTVYRRADNDSVFKVNLSSDVHTIIVLSLCSSFETWSVFPKKIVSCICVLFLLAMSYRRLTPSSVLSYI